MKSGLSQSAFAKFLGVSVRTLQDWEQGRREPCVFHTKLDSDSTAKWTGDVSDARDNVAPLAILLGAHGQ